LRIDISHADGRTEIALEGDTEACLLCSRTVIGQVQALIDYRVNVSRTMLAGPFTGVLEHVFHNWVGAFAVLNNLLEFVLQHLRDLIHLA
jgi:hypothetical protein